MPPEAPEVDLLGAEELNAQEADGEFGTTEVPNYRAFNPTFTELKIATELYADLRLSSQER